MDYPKKRKLNQELSEISSIDDLELLIESKEQLLDLKEREISLRKELIFARIESRYGLSSSGFDAGMLTKGILSDLFRNRPDIDRSSIMKAVKGATKFMPFIVRAFKRQ